MSPAPRAARRRRGRRGCCRRRGTARPRARVRRRGRARLPSGSSARGQRYRPAAMVEPFADEHIEAAAELLAKRHARHREAEPLLPADIDFRAEVEALWRQPGASGAVSESGFLIGAPRENPIWGPNVWVGLAGHAVEEAEAV